MDSGPPGRPRRLEIVSKVSLSIFALAVYVVHVFLKIETPVSWPLSDDQGDSDCYKVLVSMNNIFILSFITGLAISGVNAYVPLIGPMALNILSLPALLGLFLFTLYVIVRHPRGVWAWPIKLNDDPATSYTGQCPWQSVRNSLINLPVLLAIATGMLFVVWGLYTKTQKRRRNLT